MTFSLCYTSIRPEFIPEVVKIWLKYARNLENVDVVIAVDSGNEECLKAAEAVVSQWGESISVQVCVQPEKPFTCVKGWNLAAKIAHGDVLIAIADDFVPPKDWDKLLSEVGDPGWHLEDKVVKVWDGYNPDLCTLSILTRARYERLGYMFYPGYLSMFNDTEFTAHAKQDGAVIEAMQLLFEHHHPDCGKRQRDDHDIEHASSFRWKMGEMLFNFRKERNFPVDLGFNVKPRVPTPNPIFDKFAVYIQAVKDDFCLWEVCYRLAEDGANHFYFFIPSHYWSGELVPESDKHEVKLVCGQLRGIGCDAQTVELDVDFNSGRNRLEVETDFRNRSLDELIARGFEHAIIVDGDELWERGFLPMASNYFQECDAVQCPMIPVIGLPGYPVEKASDSAVIHINLKRGNKFEICRKPVKAATTLAIRGVTHFTATRKSHGEIIEKMRNGGHYDDPDYDFEGWIQRKLPNINPGMVNAHMYRPYQIWPSVRAWTVDEAESVPPSIRPYIGLPYKDSEKSEKNDLVQMAKLLNRPPCQEMSHSRVGVFVGGRQ